LPCVPQDQGSPFARDRRPRSFSHWRPQRNSPNLSARKNKPRPQFPQFGQALFWIFNRPTCRVAPLCRGELNGSKFWSAAKYLRRRSRIDVAAAGADLDHDRPDRRGDALASLVKDTRPTARRRRRTVPAGGAFAQRFEQHAKRCLRRPHCCLSSNHRFDSVQ
jgi:hypothetical protein